MSQVEVYFLLNLKTCGWCRKFEPVLKSNLKAMSEDYQTRCHIADRNDEAGAAVFKKLNYRGGIPCTIAVKDGKKVAEIPGYKDSNQFASMMFQLFNL